MALFGEMSLDTFNSESGGFLGDRYGMPCSSTALPYYKCSCLSGGQVSILVAGHSALKMNERTDAGTNTSRQSSDFIMTDQPS